MDNKKGPNGLLLALLTAKGKGKKPEESKTGLKTAAQSLIDAMKMESVDDVAAALKDAYECVQDGDYMEEEEEEEEEEEVM